MNTKIELGDLVKDRISGFSGIVTARSEYLNGCISVLVSPTNLDNDGKKIKGIWFDDVQLEVEEQKAFGSLERATGGPERSTPSRERPSG